MPKRSTDFQRLVALVSKHKSAGSIVTESKFLADKDGREHEVDVVIEGNVAGTPVIISIECTEQERPADDGWVNKMKGKHDRLPTDVLVLYSRSGFTKGAELAAKDFRKHLVTWESLDDKSAETLFRGPLIQKMLAQTVTKMMVALAETGNVPAEEVELYNGTPLFRESGHLIATAEVIANKFLRLPEILSMALRQCEEHHTKFEVSIPQPMEKGDYRMYCSSGQETHLRLIERLVISGKVEAKKSEVSLMHGRLEDIVVAFGKTEYEGKKALFAASKDKTEETKATFDIDGKSFPLQKPPD
jgi:hypothetical protein